MINLMASLKRVRVNARTRMQYEAAECGAASLATVLDYFGCSVELSELRAACGVNRDGSNAKQLLAAGRQYGLKARAYRCSGQQLKQDGFFPCIVFWGFNHFLVVEGFQGKYAFLSDPAEGQSRVLMDEFLDNFTGIVLEFEPGPEFRTKKDTRSPLLYLPAKLLPFKNGLIALLLAATGQAIFTILVAGFTSTFIDSFLQNQRYYLGIPIIWMLLLAVIGWAAVLTIQYLISRRMELLLSKQLASELFRKLFQVEFSFHQVRIQGELASRMLLGMETTQIIIGNIVRFGLNFWIGSLILIAAFFVSSSLSILVLLILAANLYLNWWLTDKRYDANRKLAIEQGKAQGKGLQGINNIETLKASGLEFDFLSQWQASFGNVVIQSQELGTQMAVSSIASSGSIFLLNALVIAAGGMLIINGDISLGTLIAFQFLQSQMVEPISRLPQLNSSFQGLIGSLGRLEDLRKTVDDPLVRSFARPNSSTAANKNSQDRLSGEIQLKQLGFRFSQGSPLFIQPIDLLIPAGSHVALVGSSGSGKTTLMRLLSGLYRETEGELLFDGKPWQQHNDRLIRDSLAYVPQQVFIFNASIEENITLWRPNYELKELEQAAADAQVLETINAHPESFRRQLKDNGQDLSGGERQRLELCRALLRKPSILLLDEATSALDNMNQSKVFDALKRRCITVISAAHRLDAALRSDCVIVMDNGRVVEQGNPKELLDRGGYFLNLVESEQEYKEASGI